MRKIFLVLTETGSFAFSGVPGNFDGTKRTANRKKGQNKAIFKLEAEISDENNGDNYTTLLPPAA